jgi:hypothetical protein
MASKHHTCNSLPNNPNYYWLQSLQSFDSHNEHESYMWLFLFYISTLGE